MKLIGKIVNDDEIMLTKYAEGKPSFNTTMGGREIIVGCISLDYLVSDYKDKNIEIWIRVKE